MKLITSCTTWRDSAGQRLSITYVEIDDNTHEIVDSNARKDFLMASADAPTAQALTSLAQTYLDGNATQGA